jgi:hypothetical protein
MWFTLLIQLLKQGYAAPRLKSSLQKFYCYHYILVVHVITSCQFQFDGSLWRWYLSVMSRTYLCILVIHYSLTTVQGKLSLMGMFYVNTIFIPVNLWELLGGRSPPTNSSNTSIKNLQLWDQISSQKLANLQL